MIRKRLLGLASILLCAFTVGAYAQTQIAFIGGNITYLWQQSPEFQSHSTWEGYGFSLLDVPGPCHESNQALTVLRNIIASGKKPMIHLVVGADDASGTNNANPVDRELESFETCFANLITTAQNAKLKIVVGTNPFAPRNNIDPYNKWIFYYCLLKGVPVIDYQTALNRANNNFFGYVYWNEPAQGAGIEPNITTRGYVLMDALAETVIGETAGTLKLKAGYLGNEALQMDGQVPPEPQGGVNTVVPGTQMHWYAYGEYSDGVTREINNANALQLYGTWTSSNPGVIDIDPYGNAWALAPGTANIHFTTLFGTTINEWVMYINQVSIH
jgi:hypothetical protein